MRIKLVVVVSMVCACLIGACTAVEEEKTGCDADESLCPTSSRTATDVTCDCSCVVGWSGITQTRKFTGAVAMCLPPSLNEKTASPVDLAALSSLSPGQYNQGVYQFCSDTVANYLGELISEQQRQRSSELQGICVGPRIRCSCTTRGATEETKSCSTPCEDVECGTDNCVSLLRRDNSVDASACGCSRLSACGSTLPRVGDPPLCTKRASLRARAADPS